MALDRDGSLLIVDTENHAIRRIDRASRRSRPSPAAAGEGRRWRPRRRGRARPAARRRCVGPDGAIYIGSCLTTRTRVRTRPRPGRLFERRASMISHSAWIVSPATTGFSIVELHVQKGEAGVLHRRLHQQPLGKGSRPAPPGAGRPLMSLSCARNSSVGEQHLDHAGAVDEIGDVGLGDGAADRLELPADRQILKARTRAPPSPSCSPHTSAAVAPRRPRRGSRRTATAGVNGRRRAAGLPRGGCR